MEIATDRTASNMECDVRLASVAELRQVIELNHIGRWLGDGEEETLRQISDATRRLLWLGGRWLSKKLIAEDLIRRRSILFAGDPTSLHIQSQTVRGKTARPQVFHDGRLYDRSISISHSDRAVLVAVARRGDMQVGVDVTNVQRVDALVVNNWFTPEERQRTDASRDPWLPARYWAVKEAVYKATNDNQSFNPLRIVVRGDDESGFSCTSDYLPVERLRRLHVRQVNDQITAIAVADKNTSKLRETVEPENIA